MPRDGSGTYSAPSSSFNPAVADTEISETDWNTLLDDLETALTGSISKDGQTTTTAEVPFAAGIKVNNTGLKVLDTNASHTLALVPGSNLTGNKTLTLTTGDADRTLDMSAGSLTAGGGQYAFPATQNSSSDANTLDDYEEGTWTPSDASGAALSLSSVYGAYTKIGNRLFVDLELTYPTTADGSTALLGGLPYTVANVAQPGRGPLRVDTITNPTFLQAVANTTQIRPMQYSGNYTNANLTGRTMQGSCALQTAA